MSDRSHGTGPVSEVNAPSVGRFGPVDGARGCPVAGSAVETTAMGGGPAQRNVPPAINAKVSTAAGLPPGPTTPPAEQARRWIERPLELLDECARQFGDIFTLQLGALGATVIISHPDAVRT